jgi:hypothetical protein
MTWLTVIGGVMVRVLASSAVDRGFEPRLVKPKTIKKLVFVAFPLITQHSGVTSGARRVTLITSQVTSYERGQDRIVITINGSYT